MLTTALQASGPAAGAGPAGADATAGRRPAARRPTVWRRLLGSGRFLVGMAMLAGFVACALAPGVVARTDPQRCDLSRSLEPPQAGHVFGFDLQGCDYLSRAVHGARPSLAIAVIVVGGALVVAVVLGVAASLGGPLADAVITHAADLAMGIPQVLGGLVVLAVLEERGVLHVALVLTVLSWPAMLRLLRTGIAAQLRTGHVEAAQALGAGRLRIAVRHVLAGAAGPVLVYATALTGTVVAAEATLSFMGVGLQMPTISWGLQLAAARDHVGTAPHLVLPGVFVLLAVLACLLVGDALRAALDPRVGRQ